MKKVGTDTTQISLSETKQA